MEEVAVSPIIRAERLMHKDAFVRPEREEQQKIVKLKEKSTLQKLKIYAAISDKKWRKLKGWTALIMLAEVCLAAATMNPLILGAIPATYYVLKVYLKTLARKRSLAFEQDYASTLQALSGAIKAGRDPLQALIDLEKIFDEESIVTAEIAKVRRAIETRQGETEAIRQFAATIDYPDTHFFRFAFLLARREGSGLAHCLHRLCKTTRDREEFRGNVKTNIMIQKISCYGIIIIGLIGILLYFFIHQEEFLLALNHPMGKIALGFGASALISGIFWLYKIIPDRY